MSDKDWRKSDRESLSRWDVAVFDRFTGSRFSYRSNIGSREAFRFLTMYGAPQWAVVIGRTVPPSNSVYGGCYKPVAPSFNGRTSAFEAGYGGSNPPGAAKYGQ